MNLSWLNTALSSLAQAVLTPDLFWSLLGTMALMHVVKVASMRFTSPMLRQEIYVASVVLAYPIVHRIYGHNPPIPVEILALIVGVTANLTYAWFIRAPMQKYLPDMYQTINGDRRRKVVAVLQERRKQ